MLNIISRLRRGLRRPPIKYGRLGVTGVFAVGALVVIFIAGWLVDRRHASSADRRLAALVRAKAENPLAVIARAARASRIVFLTDIHNSNAIKELAAQAVSRVANSSGLDAIIVEVG